VGLEICPGHMPRRLAAASPFHRCGRDGARRRHGGKDRTDCLVVVAGSAAPPGDSGCGMAQIMQAAPAVPIQVTDVSVMTIDPNAAPSVKPRCMKEALREITTGCGRGLQRQQAAPAEAWARPRICEEFPSMGRDESPARGRTADDRSRCRPPQDQHLTDFWSVPISPRSAQHESVAKPSTQLYDCKLLARGYNRSTNSL
jgi:hypothetical protein